MGRTQRSRHKKRNDITSNKYPAGVHLQGYMGQFGWNNHNKLTCLDFANTGRGICSKAGVSAGEVLIKLPMECMITLATLENDTEFRDIMDEGRTFLDKLSFQGLLAAYVLYRNHSESNLQPYLDSIPKAFSVPYFCPNNELYFLPESILQHTVEQNRKIRDSYRCLENALGPRTCGCCGKSFIRDIFTLNDFKWAYFAVNSRSVFMKRNSVKPLIEGESCFKNILCDEPDMAMAPFLDMFNHSDTARTESQVVNENGKLSFQLTTHDSHQPYEQIFISYGNLTNLKLLTEYGFSIANNTQDYFEISLADIEALIQTNRSFKGVHFHSNKFKFIRDHNLHDQMFIHTADGLSHNLQITLYLIFKEPSHFPNVLNQTAFGSSVDFDKTIHAEARLLILYKTTEFKSFVDGLTKLSELSCSGQAAVQYLTHCILYLESCLEKLDFS